MTYEDPKRLVLLRNNMLDLLLLNTEIHAGQNLAIGQRLVHVQRHERPSDGATPPDGLFTLASGLAHLTPNLPDRLIGGAVQDQSESSVGIVLDQQHHGFTKVGIQQFW